MYAFKPCFRRPARRRRAPFPNAFLHFFGADAATWDYTAQYLQILALGTPVVVFSNVFANLVRAEGAVQVAVMLNMLGTVTNIILDPLFISGLNLGVQGAAIATVLGNVLTALGLLFIFAAAIPF